MGYGQGIRHGGKVEAWRRKGWGYGEGVAWGRKFEAWRRK